MIRYFDKNKGDDAIIESGSQKNSIYNEIQINNFVKEDFKSYVVIQEEELLGDENYLEKVKDFLNKKYNKDGKLIRGEYSVQHNCCFHTAEDIMIFFGKSKEKINYLYDKEIKFIAPVIDVLNYLKNKFSEYKEQKKIKF